MKCVSIEYVTSTVEICVPHTNKIADFNPSVIKTFDGADNRNKIYFDIMTINKH